MQYLAYEEKIDVIFLRAFQAGQLKQADEKFESICLADNNYINRNMHLKKAK